MMYSWPILRVTNIDETVESKQIEKSHEDFHVDRKTSRERAVGWVTRAGCYQRRGMTIVELSLTDILIIRPQY